MPIYKIYKITSANTDLIYVGKTIRELRFRFYEHRADYKSYLTGIYRHCTSFKVFEHGDCSIELIEETDDKLREFYWVKELNACNHVTNETFDRPAYMKTWHEERLREKIPCDNCSRVVCRINMLLHKKTRRCQNKEPIREIKSERIACDNCGRFITAKMTSMARHKRTKICQNTASTL